MENQDAIAEKLVSLASKCFGRPEAEIDRGLALQEQGADSLGFADFLFDVEDTFGVEIANQTEVLHNMKTIDDLAAYIAARKAAA